MSRHKVQKSSFGNNATPKKSSSLKQARSWTNPYQQSNDQGSEQPTNTVKPPTTEEWLKDNIMLKTIETRQAQLQQQAIQAKLTVGEPGDKYEQEADMMASRVMSMPDNAVQRASAEVQTKPANAFTPIVQRAARLDRGGTSAEVQTKSANTFTPIVQRAARLDMGGTSQASGNIESRLNSTKGSGRPLPNDVRGFMEPRFGANFSQVRVHTGSEAVQMSRELGAQAFTHGSDVYYGEGKAPGNNELTAHELTHVVQQTGVVQPKPTIMRQDAGTPKTATPQPTDAGLVAGVPATTRADLDNLPEDLRNFLTHGLFGPKALVPPTNMGGFDASYDPQTGQLLIQVKTGIDFNDGLSIDKSGVIKANHAELYQAGKDARKIPDPANRQAFVAQFVWNDRQKQTFITDLQARVEGAWSSSATGLAFTCTRPGWESVTARVTVDVDVHEGAAGAADHLQIKVYKVPDNGYYDTLPTAVDSDRNDYANTKDQDPHNNQLLMASTEIKPTPKRRNPLRKSVSFEPNSAVLSTKDKKILQGFAADFQDANLDLTNPVQLVGYTSSTGLETYNLQLTQRRIKAVRNYLSYVGFTGINERVSTDNQRQLGVAEASQRVDLIVGSGEGQLVAAHEFGHVFGLEDEYASSNENPGGTIDGTGSAVGTAVGHDQMARNIGTSGAIAENNDSIMSLGNTIRGEHYATFGWSLEQVTGVTEWKVG
ncbi:OmpA/MotB domain-containing protein [Cylindrospermum sp. NIES-4074]|nr:OmpA/MotB domain-containing protein [Cylindrospermum sp. NIES-4074]